MKTYVIVLFVITILFGGNLHIQAKGHTSNMPNHQQPNIEKVNSHSNCEHPWDPRCKG